MEDSWDYILGLDEELLLGGVLVSEWSAHLIRNADIAYCADAPLASILVAQAAIECHLRHLFVGADKRVRGFYSLIEQSPLNGELKRRLHELRRFRNHWVHVEDPDDDRDLLERPEYHEVELGGMARKALRLMREVAYHEQFV